MGQAQAKFLLRARRRARALLGAAAATVVLAGLAVTLVPGAANANPYHCYRQGGEYRAWCADVTPVGSGESLPLRAKAAVDAARVSGTDYHNGDHLALACWATSPPQEAVAGDPYWFSVFDPNNPALNGYLSDHDLTTGSPADWKPVVAECSGNEPPPTTGKPYQCYRQGGEYRAWCAGVTAVSDRSLIHLLTKPAGGASHVTAAGYSNGASLALVCWSKQPSGVAGDPYWFSVFDPNNPALNGYLSDHYLTTGSPADWKPVVKACDHTPPPPGERPIQLQGDHHQAGAAAGLADRLGQVSLRAAMRVPRHFTQPLSWCAYQFPSGNVMPAGNVVTGGFCWDALDEDDSNWAPQGITTTADAHAWGSYGGHRYLAVSWHNHANTRARVTFVDMDRQLPFRAYRHVLLVKAVPGGCQPIGVHAGGMAWFGDTLFVAGDKGLYVFDLKDLARADARKGCGGHGYAYVLPQVGRYSPRHNPMGLDSMSIDREGGTPTLVVGDYSTTRLTSPDVARYQLDSATGLLAEDGHHRATAIETYHTGVTTMQGVLAHGKYLYLSVSRGDDHGQLVTWDGNPAHTRRHCWSKTGENLAYDDGDMWSLTELITPGWHFGHRIVFKTPLSHYRTGSSRCGR